MCWQWHLCRHICGDSHRNVGHRWTIWSCYFVIHNKFEDIGEYQMHHNLRIRRGVLKIPKWMVKPRLKGSPDKRVRTWWHVMKMAAHTQAPAMPLPDACWRNELLKSWWGPKHEPQVLDVVVDTVLIVLEKSSLELFPDVVSPINDDIVVATIVSAILIVFEQLFYNSILFLTFTNVFTSFFSSV